jgi:hypothetical protein
MLFAQKQITGTADHSQVESGRFVRINLPFAARYWQLRLAPDAVSAETAVRVQIVNEFKGKK